MTVRHSAMVLALLSGAMWGSNYNLSITFLDGDPSLQQRVKDAAAEWLKHAAINFVYTNDPKAEFLRHGMKQ